MNKPVTLENNDKKTYEVRISGQIFTLSPNPVSELEIFRFLHGLNGGNGYPKNPENPVFWQNNDEKAYGERISGEIFTLNPNPVSKFKKIQLDNLEKPFHTVFYRYFVKKPDF